VAIFFDEARGKQLPTSHDPALSGRKRGDGVIRVVWCPHMGYEAPRTQSSPPRRARTVGVLT
jgi:hypothetical protein